MTHQYNQISNQGCQVHFHIPSLDGIRAVAVMLVVLTHCGYAFASATVGVNIFFFLSGFLITTLLRREYVKTGRISFRNFYIRRALRILPPMYMLLTVALALSTFKIIKEPTDLGVVVAQYFHLTNYCEILGSKVLVGTDVMWSLSVEEHFYLVFPFLFVFVFVRGGIKKRLFAVVAICMVVLAWRFFVVLESPVFDNVWANRGSDTRLDSILWGGCLAMFANPFFEPEKADKLNRPFLGVIAVVILLFSQFYHAQWYWHTFRYTLQCFCFAPLFILAMCRPKNIPFMLLNIRPMRWIGIVSYSVYLVHYLVIYVLTQHMALSRPILFIMTLAITLPICALSERFVEKPAANLRKRFSR